MDVRDTQHEKWAPLTLSEWRETQETFHMRMQIVGKVKLKLTPFLNQWWTIGFTFTPRGITSRIIPAEPVAVSIDFDVIDHMLYIRMSDDRTGSLPLIPRSVADFCQIAEVWEHAGFGFWPGNATPDGVTLGEPAFYAYALPAPPGFAGVPMRPEGARYSPELGEFMMPYKDLRNAGNPDDAILAFFETACDAIATLGEWERASLERTVVQA